MLHIGEQSIRLEQIADRCHIF